MPALTSAVDTLLVWAVIGYALGSVPFGLILTRLMGLGNLRQIGSGNIGATNVLRTGNKAAAALTLILDGGKGALAVLLARSFAAEDAVQLAALTAFIGHCFPVWLGFKGGKGVATFIGIWLAYAWPVGLACCATWLFMAWLRRISSLAAIMMASLSSFYVLVFGEIDALLLAAVLTLLVFWRHKDNIARLRLGTEPKIGSKS